MKIELTKIPTDFKGERCYVHARGLIMPDGFGLITTQKLELSGCDVFYGLEMMKTKDGGKTFSDIVPCENLKRIYFEDTTSVAMCDATPYYHKKTGKIILTGHTARYGADNALLEEPRPRETPYAVYDEKLGDFSAYKFINMPETPDRKYFSAGAGCTQILELECGDLLVPFYFNDYEGACDSWHSCSSVSVMRCSFDGEEMKIVEIGNELTVDVPRGLGEPSIARHGNEYLLCLRNDVTGYVAKSTDGLHYDTPVELCFDDGENLGNYNTQQHWLDGGRKLYLVYTRRAGNNDHVTRNRAPLFIAEFDTECMCVIRDTENIAVPERGARLGNFGCQSFSDEVGYVFASEWMQGPNGTEGCMKYGSDNTIFLSKITYND
jgi:hypothetical protein